MAREDADESGVAEAAPLNRRRRLRRLALLLGVPLVALAAGLWLYLAGGRFVSTDNAYVRAGIVTLAPEVSGTVAAVLVAENEAVAAGQPLLRLDPEPFRIALAGAEAALAAEGNALAALRHAYRQRLAEIAAAEADVTFFADEHARQRRLAGQKVASAARLEEAEHDLTAARHRVAALREQAQAALAELQGDEAAPLEAQARYRQALARVEAARRDLARSELRAPRAGLAANTDSVQVGEYLMAGQPAFSLVPLDATWIEANLKETDITFVAPGDPVRITVDGYPGRVWRGAVAGIGPATGAEFSVLPPQNASGNWIKVVQRIPVRIALEEPVSDMPPLRAGMSTEVEIDTGHRRSLADLAAGIGRWLGL